MAAVALTSIQFKKNIIAALKTFDQKTKVENLGNVLSPQTQVSLTRVERLRECFGLVFVLPFTKKKKSKESFRSLTIKNRQVEFVMHFKLKGKEDLFPTTH